jgi:hypothetical protein
MTNTSSADNKICARFCPASVLFHPQLRFKIPQPAHNTLRSSPSVSKHYTRGLSSKLRNLRTRPCHLVHCTHNLYSKTHNLQTTSGHRLRDTALTISVQKSAICKQTTSRHPSRDTLHLAMDALGYWRHSCNITLQELLTTPTAPPPQPMTYRDSFIRKSTTRYKSSMQTKRQYLNGTKVDSAPSGEEDAELVVIRHCQTRNGALPVGAFWDTTAFTIQTLAAKGYSTDFLYGYDWHWRAEEICISRGNRSAAKWPQAVKRVERVPKTAPKTVVFCHHFHGYLDFGCLLFSPTFLTTNQFRERPNTQ